MYTLLKKSLLLNWVYVLAWASGIFILSSQSISPDSGIWMPPYSDKVIHAAIYAVLACLLFTALYNSGLSVFSSVVLSILLASLYGVTDEWHQSFVPERTSDIYDWVADTVGTLFVFLLARKKTWQE